MDSQANPRGKRENLKIIGTSVAAIGLTLLIPSHGDPGFGVGLEARVSRPISPNCIIAALEKEDAGSVVARHPPHDHWQWPPPDDPEYIEVDRGLTFVGRPAMVSINGRRIGDVFEIRAGVDRLGRVPPSRDEWITAERASRAVIKRALKECLVNGAWDGGLTCSRRGFDAGTCIDAE
jgi:hypothetical protein